MYMFENIDNKNILFQNFCIQVPILKLPGSNQPAEQKEITKRVSHFHCKIRFELADIIYDMSKARHLLRSVSLTLFYIIRQPAI